jgi:hypothetical protein
VLFIRTDDQARWAMGASGNADVHTPNMDRRRREGAHCVSAIVATSTAIVPLNAMPTVEAVARRNRRRNIRENSSCSFRLSCAGWAHRGGARATVEGIGGDRRAAVCDHAQGGQTCI